jgi:hypothetical protein
MNLPMAPTDPEARPLVLAGLVSAWDPRSRVLHIGGHELWLLPQVSLANLAIGKLATAIGHEEHSGRRFVRRLTVG